MVLGGQCVGQPDGSTCGGCGAHEFCDTSATPDACACVPGYTGDPCTFQGLIRDPSFQQLVDTGAWVNEDGKGAAVLPGELGDVDSGEGDLDDSVICNGGSLLQVVEMPSYELADPFVVEVNYKAEGVHGLAVGFGRSWTRLPPTGPNWEPGRFCIGEGGYGRDPAGNEVEVRISASERLANCYYREPGSSIRVDHFRIVRANDGECLAPGSVRNGTVEAQGEAWEVLTEQDAQGGLAPGEGREGEPGMRIRRAAGAAGRATMATQMSVPLAESLPSAALVFWWRGSSGHLFDVELGTLIDLGDRGRQVDTLAGTGSGLPYIACLPPWTHGSELDLSFSLPEGGADLVELVVDEVQLTSDSRCGTDPDLLDPGFESAPNRWFGSSVLNSGMTRCSSSAGSAGRRPCSASDSRRSWRFCQRSGPSGRSASRSRWARSGRAPARWARASGGCGWSITGGWARCGPRCWSVCPRAHAAEIVQVCPVGWVEERNPASAATQAPEGCVSQAQPSLPAHAAAG